MAIENKDKRREILTGNVVNPDENRQSDLNEDQNTGQNRIGGNTISGAGHVSPGDASGDFDRPGSGGNPPVNDYVEKDLGENTSTSNDARSSMDTESPLEDDVRIPDNIKFTDPASGFPGKGAINTTDQD